MTAEEIVALLDLAPHPEGGHFREIFRDEASTAIYFLLKAGERSHWHRVDAAEAWHHYAGGPLELSLSADGESVSSQVLGKDLDKGERPFALVPPHVWQAARPLDDWVLVGCTVAPPFRFEGFEMAPPGWEPTFRP
jgi:predicted cupin superfamily sugar epimerase